MTQFGPVIEALEFIKEDPIILKKVKEKADHVITLLKESAQDPEFTIDKVLRELEELDSSEIPSYDRTQLWDIISLLESSTA
ncbi:hypothetical protein GOV03_02400 [Candidatus Woesearchaeota archaeon]|nr:hypothetical protein [Candidatus Woesearchaeota archaeon]